MNVDWMKNIDWKALIVAILAGGLSFSLILAVFGGVFGSGRPLGEKGGEVFIALGLATIQAISAYLAKANNHKDDK